MEKEKRHPLRLRSSLPYRESCDSGKDDDERVSKIVRKGRGILGTVLHYAVRLEYQGRGKGHYHILLWIAECPKIKSQMTEAEKAEVEAYVTSVATVSIPDPEKNPRLFELVERYQTHTCRPACATGRSVTVTTPTGERILKWRKVDCRYGFPVKPSPKFVINDPDEAAKGLMKTGASHKLYQLQRKADEALINPFNPPALFILEENMDWQVIADETGRASYYTTKYVTKEDKPAKGSELWEAARKIKPDASARSRMFSVAIGLLKTFEMGQEAAADFLFTMPLFQLSDTTAYLTVNPPGKRRHVIRGRQADLEELEAQGRGGDCPVYPGFWDGVYPFRHPELDDLCAFEVFERFEKISEEKARQREAAENERVRTAEAAGRPPPDSTPMYASMPGTPDGSVFYLIPRQTPKITYTRRFRAETEDAAEETAHCLLLLFKPYRDDSKLLGDHSSFRKALEAERESMPRYLEYLSRTRERERVDEELRKLRTEVEEELSRQEAEPANANDDVQSSSLGANRILAGQELQDTIAGLNSRQRTIFRRVIDQLRHLHLHREECQDKSVAGADQRCSWISCSGRPQPLRQIVLGKAGSGKSRLIAAVTGQVNKDALLPSALLAFPVGSDEEAAALSAMADEASSALQQPFVDAVRLGAPTAVAAWLIGGSTLHSTFAIPVPKTRDNAPIASDLQGPKLKQKRAEFKSTRLVVIDELSMVSNKTLYFIHLQLSTITGNDTDWFGGMPVLLLGDLAQLQPVKAQPAFVDVCGDVFGITLGMPVNVWRQFAVDFLEQSMRAKDDPAFASLLDEVALGNVTDDVLQALDSRRIFASSDGTHQVDKRHPKFTAQCLPPETSVWHAEDYMSEEELEEAAATWAMEWETKHPGRDLTILLPRVQQCRNVAALSIRLRNLPFVTVNAEEEQLSGIRGRGGKPPKKKRKTQAGKKKKNKKKTQAAVRSEDAGGLEPVLELGVGIRVMVRKNIDDTRGLVNGAIGVVTKLERSADGRRIEHVYVRLKATGREERIQRTSATFRPHKTSSELHVRSQFPLIPAYAITVHKSQGLTLDAVLVDLGHLSAVTNLPYVALSRSRSLAEVYILRLHPGVFAADEDCVQRLNFHRELIGLPRYDRCNFMTPRFPTARRLVFGRKRPSISPRAAYSNTPQPPASGRAQRGRGRGRGQGRGAQGAGIKVNRGGATSSGGSRGTSSRGRPGPSSGRVGGSASPSPLNTFPVTAPTHTGPHLPPLPTHLQADAAWIVSTFSRPASFRLLQDERLPFITSLQNAMTVQDSPARLLRITAWLRTLPICTLESLGPAAPPEDVLAPTRFLYPCLLPLLRSVSTSANGDCQLNSVWGSVCGTSSTWHARLLRGALVATVCFHWDHFLGLQAVANASTPQDYAEHFCTDIVDAATSTSFVEDSLLYPLSFLLAREIHLYQRCDHTGLTGVHSATPVTPTLLELTAALNSRSLMKILRFAALPIPPARNPILMIYNGHNHYATILPRSNALQLQLPRPVLYLNAIPEIRNFQVQSPLPAPDWTALNPLPQPPLPVLPPVQPHPPPPPVPPRVQPQRPAIVQSTRAQRLVPIPWPTWGPMHKALRAPNPNSPVARHLNARISLVTGDITTLQVDAIVNAANGGLRGGSGIDGVIHKQAGPRLLQALMAWRRCPTGQAVTTPGFNIPVRHIIHAVGPVYSFASPATSATELASAYKSALTEALKHGCTTVAFPCISIGIFGYPSNDAADVAVGAVRAFLQGLSSTSTLSVVFCLYKQTDEGDYAAALPAHFPLS